MLPGPAKCSLGGYLNNTGDRQLAGISNVGLTAGQFLTYSYSRRRSQRCRCGSPRLER